MRIRRLVGRLPARDRHPRDLLPLLALRPQSRSQRVRRAAGPGRESLRIRAGIALLATTLGGLLIIPPFVSVWRTIGRIKRAQELAGVEDTINHVLGFVLFLVALIFFPIEIPYAQSHVNKVWRLEAEEAAKWGMGMRGVPETAQ